MTTHKANGGTVGILVKSVKTLVVYMSIAHKNTEKVAKVLADKLSADLKKADETDPNILLDYDLVGFGSGIYNKKHHERLFTIVDELPSVNSKNAFIFSTSGWGEKRIDKYHEPLRKKLMEKGFNVIGEFACFGLDTEGILRLTGGANKGRPNEEDLKRADDFARTLLKK